MYTYCIVLVFVLYYNVYVLHFTLVYLYCNVLHLTFTVRYYTVYHLRKSPWTRRRAEGEWEDQTSDGWMEWWGMQRGWESEIGRARPRIEMVGGNFLSRARPCMGCSAWEGWVCKWVSESLYCTVLCFFTYSLIPLAVPFLLFFCD